MKLHITPPAKPGTLVERCGTGSVKISHRQAIKQSLAYQTVDLEYAVELIVADNDKAVGLGILRAERLVEDALGEKMPQTTELLNSLAAQNRS